MDTTSSSSNSNSTSKIPIPPRLVLMSATLDSGLFAKYFSPSHPPPYIQVRTRTYSVEPVFLDELTQHPRIAQAAR